MTIMGAIPTLGINTPTVLFTASFLGGSFAGSGVTGSFVAGISLASVVLAPQLGLYNYEGGDNDDIVFNISGTTCSTGGICSGPVNESDTTFQTIPIPEPTTLSVLVVGLFTCGNGLRRRMATNKAA
jgi:hypothetical protein